MQTRNFHDILTVIKFTMRDILGRKSFRISTAIITILIILGFNIPNFLNSFTNEGPSSDTILVLDHDNVFEGKIPEYDDLELSTESTEAIEEKIMNDEISAAIYISRTDSGSPHLHYLVKNMVAASEMPTKLLDAFIYQYTANQVNKLNLTPTQTQQILPSFRVTTSQVDTQEVGGNIFVMMILSCILFFAIYFCAYQVSISITVEKTSKIMETLVTSTTPRTIILGKTIGIGLVGLIQILLFAIVALISAYTFLDPTLLNAMFDLSTFTPLLAIIMIVYFILGYFMYALLYALTGSTVSKPEDVQSANMPIAFITMIGFYLSYFTLSDPTGDLNFIAALLPISSPFCMPLRVMMGIASAWEVTLSIAILIVACVIIAHIAIKIYSNAILNYGTKMSLGSLLKIYKEK